MSENEAYEAQGRAHASLKRLKSEIATIKAELLRRNQELAALARMVDQVVHDPAHQDSGAPVPRVFTLEQRLREIDLASMAALAEELFQKTGQASVLEEQIKNF